MHKMAGVLCLTLLTGCGGGTSDSDSRQSSAVPDGGDAALGSAPALDGQPRGVLVVEERSGKRVIDAWFSRVAAMDTDTELLWQETSAYCERLVSPMLDGVITASTSIDAGAVDRVGTHWRHTLDAGNTIDISARTGTIFSLQAQHYGTAVLYASDERWLAEPLPEDARLRIAGSAEFPAFESIPLKPLSPLVRTAPVDGVTDNPSAAITWESSADTDDGIELTMSMRLPSVGQSADEQTVHSVRCSLSDSGQFTLPEAVQNLVAGASHVTLNLVRVRTHNYTEGEAALRVVQLSYAR